MSRLEYIANQCDQEILILGSSRAKFHYNPEILTDSTGMSCFNCGRNGMGIFYCYGYWKMLSKRYLPKVILYDYTTFDVELDDRSAYIAQMLPYSSDPDVYAFIKDVDKVEAIKSRSHLYRYNSLFLQLIMGFFTSDDLDNGFLPHKGELTHIMKRNYDRKVDSLKIAYLKNFVADVKSKGVKLVFFNSPFYDGAHMKLPEELSKCFEKNGVDFYDNQDLEGFTGNKKLFFDVRHLNDQGADAYTKIVVDQLRKAR